MFNLFELLRRDREQAEKQPEKQIRAEILRRDIATYLARVEATSTLTRQQQRRQMFADFFAGMPQSDTDNNIIKRKVRRSMARARAHQAWRDLRAAA